MMDLISGRLLSPASPLKDDLVLTTSLNLIIDFLAQRKERRAKLVKINKKIGGMNWCLILKHKSPLVEITITDISENVVCATTMQLNVPTLWWIKEPNRDL